VPVRDLKRVTETEVRTRVAAIQLGNNGGQFDRIAQALLLDQILSERGQRVLVQRMKLRCRAKRLCFRLDRAAHTRRGGLLHEIKES